MPCRVGNKSLRLGSLAVGCLATGMAYTLDAFTVYSEDLKVVFGAKQSQVETIISAGYLGLLSSLPAGLLQNRFGPRWMSFLSLLFSVLGSALSWCALHNKDFHVENVSMFALYYFLMGIGGGIMYVTASSVSFTNFGLGSLGLVSGMVHAFRSGIPGLLMVLYMYTFSASYYDDSAGYDRLYIYYATITVSYLVANVMAICVYGFYKDTGPGKGNSLGNISVGHLSESFHHSISQKANQMNGVKVVNKLNGSRTNIYKSGSQSAGEDLKSENHTIGQDMKLDYQSLEEDFNDNLSQKDLKTEILSESSPLLKKEKSQEEVTVKGHTSRRESALFNQRTLWNSVLTPEFHLIFWPSSVVLGQRSSYGANIRAFADSFHMHTYAQIILTLLPVVSTLSKPPIGLCSDALIRHIPRSLLLIIWTLGVVVVDVLSVFLLGEVAVQAITVVTVILCSSFIQTLAPPLMVSILGRRFFPIGWACVTLGWSGFTSLFNFMIGYFYDINTVPGQSLCVGQACYRYTFLIFASVCSVSTILYCFLLKRELHIRRNSDY